VNNVSTETKYKRNTTFKNLYLFFKTQKKSAMEKSVEQPINVTQNHYLKSKLDLGEDQFFSLEKIDKIINRGIFNIDNYVKE